MLRLIAPLLLLGVPAAAAPSLKVGVLYFDNLTGDPTHDVLQKGLADMIITDLSGVPGVVVVERARLQDVLAEQSLQASKFFDPTTAVKTGKLVGATHVLTGTLSAVDPRLRIDLRLIDVKKGAVLATSTITGPKENLFELEQELMTRFVSALALKGAIPKPASAGTSADALLAYSKGLDQADRGDLAGAQSTMANVKRAAPGFALAKARYAELLQRVAAATEKRTTVLGAQEAELVARIARAQATPVQPGMTQAEELFGYRVMGVELALQRLRLAITGPDDATGSTQLVSASNRSEVGRLEVAAIAAIDQLRRDLMAFDPKPPHEARFRFNSDDGHALGELVPSRNQVLSGISIEEPELRVLRARILLAGDLNHMQYRPTAVERTPELLDTALAQTAEAGGDAEHETFFMTDSAGVALVRAGRKEDAIARWQKYLDAHPRSPHFADVRKRIEDTLMVSPDVVKARKDLETCAAESMMSWQRLFQLVALVDRRPGVERMIKQIDKCAPKQGALAMGWRVNGLNLGAQAAAELGDCALLASLKQKGMAMPVTYRQAFQLMPACR